LRHQQFWPIEDSDCALLVTESKTDHDSQNHALLHYFSAKLNITN